MVAVCQVHTTRHLFLHEYSFSPSSLIITPHVSPGLLLAAQWMHISLCRRVVDVTVHGARSIRLKKEAVRSCNKSRAHTGFYSTQRRQPRPLAEALWLDRHQTSQNKAKYTTLRPRVVAEGVAAMMPPLPPHVTHTAVQWEEKCPAAPHAVHTGPPTRPCATSSFPWRCAMARRSS